MRWTNMLKYSNHDLAELAHQLTLSPVRQRLRQLEGIEQLLGIIDRDQAYPYDLVCYHITGYRKRQGDQTRPAIRGDKLTADLVTMAEHLTRKTEVSVDELAGGLRTLEELAEHLHVSTKTIRRWRTRGLMGIRVRDKDGVARVVFRNGVVDRFVEK
ncbi:MAG: MerR family transcriptional regulator, partial [Phycisphaerae bacterium]|nr:MerR family transcriptional regulator [Phycisphaerae bacterium]